MKPLADLCLIGIRSTIHGHPHAISRKAWLALILFFTVLGASAQTITWSDNFVQGMPATAEQCTRWNDFRAQLAGKSFAAVTISGTFDERGKTLSDFASATTLAQRLSTGTPAVVTFGGQTWAVGTCGPAQCGGLSVTLSVDGSTNACNCNDRYAIKPATRLQWGGVNTSTCNGPTQEMRLVFHSAVSITADVPTEICPGESVQLTANIQGCAGPYTYLWSNNATTQSISVSEAGSYSVKVTGNGCSGVSSPTVVTVSPISVDAGEEALFCTEPVQLNATGTPGSTGEVHKYCIFDAPGGAGNCTFPATEQVCGNAAFYTSGSFSTTVSVAKPEKLRFKVYYSNFSKSTSFVFKVNDDVIGTSTDADDTRACNTRSEEKFPREFRFDASQFNWNQGEGASNRLTLEIVSDGEGVLLAGVAAEVELPITETYSWTPTEGLSNASIANPLASPDVTTNYTVTYSDGVCTVTDNVNVVNCNTPPVALCKPVVVDATTTCAMMVEAADFDDGSKSNTGGQLGFSVFPLGPYPVGETTVTLTVTDLMNSKSSTCVTTVTVNDVTSPVITTQDLIVANDAGACSATVALAQPETSDNCGIETITHDQADTIFPVGETIVTWTVTDIHGNIQTATQKVVVNDTESPAVTVADLVVASDPGACSANITLQPPTSSDNCGVATATHDQTDATFPVGETMVTWTVTDVHGNVATATQQITVNDTEAPMVTVADLVVANDPGACSANITLQPPTSSDNCGVATATHDQTNATFPVGETMVTWTVTDVHGNVATATQQVIVNDTEAPLVTVTDVIVANEPGACSATVILQPPTTSDNCGVASVTHDHADAIFPVGEPTTVIWTVTDVHGNTSTATQNVTVTNSVPVISSVTASASTVQTLSPVSLNISYTDINNNVKSATVDWGDLSMPEVVENPATIFDVTHAYAIAGTYVVTITVTDLCNASSTPFEYHSITVIEKRAGFVEGNGWFNSLPGYYRKDGSASGKAHFGFEAQYSSDGGVLTGNATFKFKAGRLQFVSNDFDVLEIDGGNAFLIGTGKLNGKRGYGILISMVDSDYEGEGLDLFASSDGKRGKKGRKPHVKDDRIRVRIWDKKGEVVYDTQPGAADHELATTNLGGGNIMVNTSDTGFDGVTEDSFTTNFGEGSTSVYPNPFADWIEIRLTSASQENIQVQLMDLTGKVIYSAQLQVNEDGTYSLNLPENENSRGIFILKISQGRRVEILRMVRE